MKHPNPDIAIPPELPHPQLLLEVAVQEARARAASDISTLAFSIANDAFALLQFRQALVFSVDRGRWELLAVSGLARPAEDSPYLIWLRQIARWLPQQLAGEIQWLARETLDGVLPSELASGWAEWWPAGAWCIPLKRRDGSVLGWVLYLMDEAPPPPVSTQVARLGQTWSYCWEMLTQRQRPWRLRPSGRQTLIALAVLCAVMLIPVRQSALAPAEVISQDAVVVTSPLDGVVKTFHVRPNQLVKKGQLLLSLDDTTLGSRIDVARKSVAVADAELLAATQKAFDSTQSKGEIALLGGRSQERRAELGSLQQQLARIEIMAPRDGVAVFADTDDWIGKPVVTGERILQIADPTRPAILMQLAVADAINLDAGAPVKLYLTAHPLTSFDGEITETSYQAIASPEGGVYYRLRARFEGQPELARIGLKGTAKIYGGKVMLGYYLMRRPLAALREWSGV